GQLKTASRDDAIAAAIAALDLFRPLSAEEKEEVAKGARERRYAEGETIVREGEHSASMFLIESGRVSVSIHGAAGDTRRLAVIEEGAAFGEISLLTGDPRTATVRALTEATLLEIDKATISPILRENPSLCGMLELTMQERRKRAADALEAAGGEAEQTVDKTPLSLRIARFFGLKG
nr:cyclic nucleotide-binding domain-containing protein [Acidobacteriota bacterium]